jgi:hypothetical protein
VSDEPEWPTSGIRPGRRGARPIFDQIEAILSSDAYTAIQKCLLIWIRCRVDGRSLSGARVSMRQLMRAASVSDVRTLRAHLEGLALVTRTDQPGHAPLWAFTPERLQAIVDAYMASRPPAADAPPAVDAPHPLQPVQGDPLQPVPPNQRQSHSERKRRASARGSAESIDDVLRSMGL